MLNEDIRLGHHYVNVTRDHNSYIRKLVAHFFDFFTLTTSSVYKIRKLKPFSNNPIDQFVKLKANRQLSSTNRLTHN